MRNSIPGPQGHGLSHPGTRPLHVSCAVWIPGPCIPALGPVPCMSTPTSSHQPTWLVGFAPLAQWGPLWPWALLVKHVTSGSTSACVHKRPRSDGASVLPAAQPHSAPGLTSLRVSWQVARSLVSPVTWRVAPSLPDPWVGPSLHGPHGSGREISPWPGVPRPSRPWLGSLGHSSLISLSGV